MLSRFSCVQLCDPMDCSPPGASVHGDSPGKNTGVGCHARLQGIVLTRGSNLDLLRLLHYGRLLYCSAIGKSCILKCPYPIPLTLPPRGSQVWCSEHLLETRPSTGMSSSSFPIIDFRTCIYIHKVFSFFSSYIIYLAVPSLSCGVWHLVPQPGIRPRPPHWEYGVLKNRHQVLLQNSHLCFYRWRN